MGALDGAYGHPVNKTGRSTKAVTGWGLESGLGGPVCLHSVLQAMQRRNHG